MKIDLSSIDYTKEPYLHTVGAVFHSLLYNPSIACRSQENPNVCTELLDQKMKLYRER